MSDDTGIPYLQLLQHMQVPEHPRVYLLGCLERRVTVYSQQVRALNLVYALERAGVLGAEGKAAVIGGGIAGLTAAAGLVLRGFQVTVLEKESAPLHLFHNCTKRWLHPHIYDWPKPGSLRDHADLPILTWQADIADRVGTQIRTQWEAIISQCSDRIKVLPRVAVNVPVPKGSRLHMAWRPGYNFDEFDVVILALGFGIERSLEPIPPHSYWHDDALDQSDHGKSLSYLISGVGDGGLTDLLRACIHGFRHDGIVRDFNLEPDPKANPSAQALAERLTNIENEAVSLEHVEGVEAASKYLSTVYLADDLDPLVEFVDSKLRDRLRDRRVILNSPNLYPLTPWASILNRLLAARLIKLTAADYLPGKINNIGRDSQGKYRVSLEGGKSLSCDRVVIRHGSNSALQESFPQIAEACAKVLGPRNALDQTRHQLWPPDWFPSSAGTSDRRGSLNREMGAHSTMHTDDMLRGFLKHIPTSSGGEQFGENAFDAVLAPLIHARSADSAVCNQLEIAITALRQKYELLQFRPAERLGWLRAMPRLTDENLHAFRPVLEELFRYGEMIISDLVIIPGEIMAYARAHGFRPHDAVMGGMANGMMYFGLERLRDGISPTDYMLTNLERILEAAVEFLALGNGDLNRGYLQCGTVNRSHTDSAKILIAVALPGDTSGNESANYPSIVLFAVHDSNGVVEAARLYARTQPYKVVKFGSLGFTGGVAASSWRYIYRWEPVSATPVQEWATTSTSPVAHWALIEMGGEQAVALEDCGGEGVVYGQSGELGRWQQSFGEPCAFWARGGSLYRAYLRRKAGEENISVFRGFEMKPMSTPLNFEVDIATRSPLQADLKRYTSGSVPLYRIERGELRGNDCLVMLCPLEPPGKLAFFFLDPYKLGQLRKPLICPWYVENYTVIDAGARSLLIATLMRNSGGAIALWEITGGTDPCPEIIGEGSDGGWEFCCVSNGEQVDIYFTTVPSESSMRSAKRGELCRVRWPDKQVERLVELPATYVASIAVRRS